MAINIFNKELDKKEIEKGNKEFFNLEINIEKTSIILFTSDILFFYFLMNFFHLKIVLFYFFV